MLCAEGERGRLDLGSQINISWVLFNTLSISGFFNCCVNVIALFQEVWCSVQILNLLAPGSMWPIYTVAFAKQMNFLLLFCCYYFLTGTMPRKINSDQMVGFLSYVLRFTETPHMFWLQFISQFWMLYRCLICYFQNWNF